MRTYRASSNNRKDLREAASKDGLDWSATPRSSLPQSYQIDQNAFQSKPTVVFSVIRSEELHLNHVGLVVDFVDFLTLLCHGVRMDGQSTLT